MPRRFALIAASSLIAVFAFFLNVQFLLPALAQTTKYSVFRTSYPGFNFRSTDSAYGSMFSTIRFGATGPFIGLTGGGGNGKVAILASKGAALGTPGLFIQSIDPNSNSLLSAISLYPPTANTPGQVAFQYSKDSGGTWQSIPSTRLCQMRGGKATGGLRDTTKRFNINPAFPTNVNPVVLLTPTSYATAFKVSSVSYSYFDATFQQNTDFFWMAYDPTTCFNQ